MPSKKRLVGLRLDEATYKKLERLAREDVRSLAQMAEILLLRGMDSSAPKKPKSARKVAPGG